MPWAKKIHCTQCGSLVAAEAKYCAKCGSPVVVAMHEKTAGAPAVSVSSKKPRILWIYIAAVLTFLIYAGMFIPAMSGREISRGSSQSATIITGLLFYLSWRRLDRKGWHGALIGAGVGLVLSFLAGAIYGFMRHVS